MTSATTENHLDEPTTVHTFRVKKDDVGERLDKALAQQMIGSSRSYIQQLMSGGHVSIDGQVATTKARKLAKDQIIEVEFIPPEKDLPIVPEDIDLEVLHEDPHFVAVNKPAGMVVHPAPGHWTGTLVHALAHRYGDILELGGPRPGVVHRLDKGTTGVILAARTPEAHRALASMFEQRQIHKTYLAVTVRNPAGEGCLAGMVSEPIGRSRTDRLRMGVVPVEAGGKHALSTFQTIAHDSRGFFHLVQVGIETGRTHQIRVHMRHRRTPVLGDDLYGAPDINHRYRSAATRPLLHSLEISFAHPITGVPMRISAKLPEDMHAFIERSIDPRLLKRFPEW